MSGNTPRREYWSRLSIRQFNCYKISQSGAGTCFSNHIDCKWDKISFSYSLSSNWVAKATVLRPWSSYLNSVEHAWDMLQRKASGNFAENLVTESEVFMHFRLTWDFMSQGNIEKVSLSVHCSCNRCRCVVNIRGAFIDWIFIF